MARILDTTVSVDGNTDVPWSHLFNDMASRATVWVYGGGGNDFGGGTVTLQASPDNGATYIDMLDAGGTAITFAADKFINFELYAKREKNDIDQVKIRLALAGSTSPTLRMIIDTAR